MILINKNRALNLIKSSLSINIAEEAANRFKSINDDRVLQLNSSLYYSNKVDLLGREYYDVYDVKLWIDKLIEETTKSTYNYFNYTKDAYNTIINKTTNSSKINVSKGENRRRW